MYDCLFALPSTFFSKHPSDYVKAITEMTRQLRAGEGKNGLVLANGGVMTYQHVVCLSSSPRCDGSPYPDRPPLPDVIDDVPVPTVDAEVEGEAYIEVTIDSLRLNHPLECYLTKRICRPTQQNSIETARRCGGMSWAD